MKHCIDLNPDRVKWIRQMGERFVSYNVEMTEVTGGTFWKTYTPGQIAGTEAFPPIVFCGSGGFYGNVGADGVLSAHRPIQ